MWNEIPPAPFFKGGETAEYSCPPFAKGERRRSTFAPPFSRRERRRNPFAPPLAKKKGGAGILLLPFYQRGLGGLRTRVSWTAFRKKSVESIVFIEPIESREKCKDRHQIFGGFEEAA
jgi:hypothetical protein